MESKKNERDPKRETLKGVSKERLITETNEEGDDDDDDEIDEDDDENICDDDGERKK